MGGANGANGKHARNILVVDGDPEACQLLALLLGRKGYKTNVALNGQEGIQAVENDEPDLIVLDLMMPGMDGWETYLRIRERTDCPVLVLTALRPWEMNEDLLKRPATDYLEKPFQPAELFEKVEKLTKNPSQGNFEITPVQPGEAVRRRPSVSVIVPTLNEADNLPLVLPYLPMDWIDEVILVDGRSTDGTVEVAQRMLPSIRVVLENRPGKGAALQAGHAAAQGDILVVMDADGSNDPREIPRFIQALMEGADFAKGSRFAPLGGTTDMPRHRKLGNKFFLHLVNLLFGCTFTDLCYGYHAFWRSCLEVIDISDSDGFEIDTAIYLRAVRERLRIVDVPSFEGYRFHGVGKLRTIPDGWRVLRTIAGEWLAHSTTPTKQPKLGFQGASPNGNEAFEGSWHLKMPVNHDRSDKTPILQQTQHPRSPERAPSAPVKTAVEDQASISLLQRGKAEEILGDALKTILQSSLENMEATSGSILSLDASGDIRQAYLAHLDQIHPLSTERIVELVDQGLAGWIVKKRKPALVPSTLEDPRWLRRGWELYENATRSAVGVPLLAEERVCGALVLARPGDERFTEHELARLLEIVKRS